MSSSLFEQNADLKALEHELRQSNFFEIRHLVIGFTKRVKDDVWCNLICSIFLQIDQSLAIAWKDFVPVVVVPFYHAYCQHCKIITPKNSEVYQILWCFLDSSGTLGKTLFPHLSKDEVTFVVESKDIVAEVKPLTPFELFEKAFNGFPDIVKKVLAQNDISPQTVFNSDVDDFRCILEGLDLTAGEKLRLLNLHRKHIK